ncbi:MAG TPA: L-aspartate oxidase [Polyangia bacterium]|nr:L-aspartate oxidase [Polyangia bacterium]
MLETDYLVIGSGLAGLYFALRASEHGRVVVVTKRAPADANTAFAQGGVAGVLDPGDRLEAHLQDTLRTGDGLCHPDVVEVCVREAPAHIKRLADELGVPFDRDAEGHFELGREGGHTARRIVHAKDSTGWAIQEALLARVSERADRITLLPNHMAVDLLTAAKYGGPNAVFGAYLLDQATGEVKTAVARATVLATGGMGKVYLYTTNPDVATGDGVAMAYRVGARVANMEFFQFHPTCLYHPQAKSFLISEALRGEGGILRLRDGTAFMPRYHEMKDLAPRDVVSRAIDTELKRTGDDHVVLDMTHLPGDFLVERFPMIHKRCLELGIDMRRTPIPVVPAAHYSGGGVVVDVNGRSSVRNLYAIGEVSMTGLHGACRLASNSLLEAMVFAARAAEAVRGAESARPAHVAPWYAGEAGSSDEAVVVSQNWDEIRRLMWNYVGIVRSDRRLERAARRIELIRSEIREYYWNVAVNGDLLELRNLALCADLIIECARRRPESRGLHYNLDHVDKDPRLARDTVLARGDGPGIS